MSAARAAAKGELRVFLTIESLEPQFAAYMGTPTRARGYPPYAGQHALIIEVAPGLMIERVMDLALKADPDLEPGILFVERQFGILEIHGSDKDKLLAAGRAVLKGMGLTEGDQLAPRILFTDVIENIADQHAVIINRNRQASMVMPGETLLVCEMVPALYAAIAANVAEKVAPAPRRRADDRRGGPPLYVRPHRRRGTGACGDRAGSGRNRRTQSLTEQS